jgi:hypothetical protein
MFVLCVVSKGKMQENQGKETSTNEVQSTRKYKKNPPAVGGGDIPHPSRPPTSYTMGKGFLS